jgi:hypothetical protein
MSVDYPDWSVPQTNANAIAGTGVPLLRGTNNLAVATGLSIPPSPETDLLVKAAVGRPSYEVLVTLSLPSGAGTIPFAAVIMSWFDVAGNFNIDTETFWLAAGNGPANALDYYISGPCRGDLLSVQILSLEPAQNMTITISVNETSHLHPRDRLLQQSYTNTAPVGFTFPAGTPNTGVLYSSDVSIGPNSTQQRLCAAWNGKCRYAIDNNGGANPGTLSFYDPENLYGDIGNAMLTVNFAAHSTASGEVSLPNGPMLVKHSNTASTNTINPTVYLIREEY